MRQVETPDATKMLLPFEGACPGGTEGYNQSKKSEVERQKLIQ